MTAQQNDALLKVVQMLIRQELRKLLIESAIANPVSSEVPITREEMVDLMKKSIQQVLSPMDEDIGKEEAGYMTTDEVMEHLRIKSRTTIYKYRSAGILPYKKRGRSLLFERDAVESMARDVQIN